MELGPIWRALKRNTTGAVLIALQIAITLAIMLNAIAIIQERMQQMARPSGVDEDNLFYLSSVGYAPDFNEKLTIQEDLRLLRGTPGVVDAVQTNSVPLSGGGWSMGLAREPGADTDAIGVAIYFVDEHGVNTLGVDLIAGENFTETDVNWRHRSDTQWPAKGLITKAMAKALWPDEDPASSVGRVAYIDDKQAVTVVGIIDQLQAPWNGWSGVERVMLVPSHTLFGSTRYLVRTEAGQRDRLMPQIEQALAESTPRRLIRSLRSMAETRERSYRGNRAMVKMLGLIIVLLTGITALGIAGLASFNVGRRTRQIGTRRALGARRWDIQRHFITENILVSAVGILLGVAMAVGVNAFMVDSLNLPRMPLYLIPVGMLVVFIVGMLAVWAPARRASLVPPAVATRSV